MLMYLHSPSALFLQYTVVLLVQCIFTCVEIHDVRWIGREHRCNSSPGQLLSIPITMVGQKYNGRVYANEHLVIVG
jgi:hypothetical protein